MPNTVTYIAIVERFPEKEFRARFPDDPGVRMCDATIEDLGARGRTALREHIGELLQSNEGVPRPMTVDEVKEDGRYRNGFLLKIDVDVPAPSLYAADRRRGASSYPQA